MAGNLEAAGDPIVLVMCTIPEAGSSPMARLLVEARAAACVNIVNNVSSVYMWKGQLVDDKESLLLIKTTESRFSDLRELIVRNHPYECPEVVCFQVHAGAEPYLRWVRESVGQA